MEGTVTISLEDFMELQRYKEKEKYYFEKAAEYIEILGDVVTYLNFKDIENALTKRISISLENWYG